MKSFVSKLNWRLMLIHFMAIWLFMLAFKYFAVLTDYHFFNTLLTVKTKQLSDFSELNRLLLKSYPNWDIEIANDLYIIALSTLVGLLISFFISLGISIKRKWFWLNSLLSFLIALFLFMFKIICQRDAPYNFHIHINNIFWLNSITGTLMLVIALILFFSKRVKEFINPIGETTSEPDSFEGVNL